MKRNFGMAAWPDGMEAELVRTLGRPLTPDDFSTDGSLGAEGITASRTWLRANAPKFPERARIGMALMMLGAGMDEDEVCEVMMLDRGTLDAEVERVLGKK